MTNYVILLPGDEAVWANATPEQRAEMYGVHQKFSDLLAARGHKVTGGAELTHSSTGWVVRGGDEVTVTEGPYAESVEQLTGFYTVQSDDLDDLLQIVGVLARGEGAIEVRAAVDSPADGG